MPFGAQGEFGVLELNQRVRDLFAAAFPYPVWLRGEISGRPGRNTRGHSYFQLVERSPDGLSVAATIDCALFAGAHTQVSRDFAREGLVFELREGMSVRVQGRVDLWPPSGRFQFIVERVDPASYRGEQALLLRRLVEKLTREGVAALNGRLPMPAVPLDVGLVTSPGSAASEDFITTLRESRFPFRVRLCPSVMQGSGTEAGIVAALGRLEAEDHLDAVVITRGGGSGADLSWFDNEAIARAIAAAPWPVISGIGHEVDFTLPDFVCHTRAKTPTHAARILVDRVADSAAGIDSLASSLFSAVSPRIRTESARLEGTARLLASVVRSASAAAGSEVEALGSLLGSGALGLMRRARESVARPLALLPLSTGPGRFAGERRRVDELAGMLCTNSRRMLSDRSGRLDLVAGVAAALDPRRMLASGWAIATAEDGSVVRSIRGVCPGDALRVRVTDGTINARTEGTEESDDSSTRE